MGNIFSISCDAVFSRCLDCAVTGAAYVHELEANLDDLRTEKDKLSRLRNDVWRRVTTAELRRMKRTDRVAGWLLGVEGVEAEVDKLVSDGSQEIDKLCLGSYCSKDWKSSYKLGKRVRQKLQVVATLLEEGISFDEVVAKGFAAELVAEERPTDPVIVGFGSMLEEVWTCLVEGPSRIVGLYGMGGAGKTTVLTLLNNKFLECSSDFDVVIWVVASKDLRLERIQEAVGKKVGLFDDSWSIKSFEEKALDIFRILSKQKFVLLLDDVWERVDLTKLGVPLPTAGANASKVLFSTRSIDVCGLMEADRTFKVGCLSDQDAWQLFQNKVGEETLTSHAAIRELAQVVAMECGGLPLALITIGRAMAFRKTPEEWRYAIQMLRGTASEFPGLQTEVYPLLKFTYDRLNNDTLKSCFLYCCLFPEDYRIPKSHLIDCWIGEGFLGGNNKLGARNQGYYILGILLQACLLEEPADYQVKMHDVIRDMALWIACGDNEEKRKFLVYAGVGLTEAPNVREWENVTRLSLMGNDIKSLPSDIPLCPHLLTLFLNSNRKLKWISEDFFQLIPSLKVLNLSRRMGSDFPLGISKLASLQLLDLSHTSITGLPEELRALVNLKCLNLEGTRFLIAIPRQLVSSFTRLHVLRMFGTGCYGGRHVSKQNSVLFAGGERLADELLGLKHLEVLEITLQSFHALESLLSSQKVRNCIESLYLQYLEETKSIPASPLADIRHLTRLCIHTCKELEELKILYEDEILKTPQLSCVFHSLRKVQIHSCPVLKDLTFLAFAPNLKSVSVRDCFGMEEIISARKFALAVPDTVRNVIPFEKLENMRLVRLENLRIIYWKPLQFPKLKKLLVHNCYMLKKLPVDSSSAKECKSIRGRGCWWKELQWEDEATQNSFQRCFKPLDDPLVV